MDPLIPPRPNFGMLGRQMIVTALLTLLLAGPLAPNLATSAQGQARIRVHELPPPQEVSTTGGSVGLSMEASFSFLDSDDQLLTSPEIVDATMSIDENEFRADVQELETPWTIVIMVDTSSSIGGSRASADYRRARDALGNAVGGMPDGAALSLMTFDDSPRTLVNFDQPKEQIQATLRNLVARTSGSSCLHDGLYQAVNNLAGAPGRRAVVTLTASADNCLNRSAQEVIDLADANRVQLYAVGISGYPVTEGDLDALSGPTGGISYIRDQNNLGFGLSNIAGILINQWRARATVFPSAGEKTVEITVNLADGSFMKSEPVPFTSEKDYVPPTQINIRGTVQSSPDGIVFNMDYIQPQKIRQLNVSIVSNDTGQAVMSQSLLTFSDVIVIPAPGLFPELEYTLMVSAVDEAGQILSEDQSEFEYEPPQAQVVISSIDPPNFERSQFLLDVGAQNVPDAVKFRAWLAPEQSQQPIEGTRVTVPLGDPVLITAEGLPSGQYLAFAQALDASDTVLAQSAPTPFTYARPGPLETLSAWVQGSPMATIAITGVCCLSVLGLGALAWLVIPRRGGDRDVEFDLVMPDKGRAVRAPQPPRAPRVEKREPGPQPGARRPSPPIKKPPRAEPPRAAAGPPPRQAKSGAQPAARLMIVYPGEPAYSIEMRKTPFRVGRRDDNEASLPLDSSSGVSGQHLTVFYKDGKYFLRDDRSTFGTTINGRDIPKGEPAELNHGDRIGLGPMVKLSFEIIEKGGPP